MSWAQIKKSVNSNLTKPLDTLIKEYVAPASTALSKEIWTDTRAGYLDLLANSTNGLSAIRALVNTANSNILRGSVKSVQRGNASHTATTSSGARTISISTVNASKSILLINSEAIYSAPDFTPSYSLSSSAISQTHYYYGQGRYNFCSFGWQVIEFY